VLSGDDRRLDRELLPTVAVAVQASVSIPVRGSRRGRRADLEEPVQERESLITASPSEGDMRGVGAGALLQPDRGKDAHRPGDSDTHPQPSGGAPERTAVEIGAHVSQADVPANPADSPVSAGADDQGGVWIQTLAIGVAGPVVPAAQEGADDRADAIRAVAELLATDHRGELDHADAVVRRAMTTRLEAHRGERTQPLVVPHAHPINPAARILRAGGKTLS
jgi:hypothetical protein